MDKLKNLEDRRDNLIKGLWIVFSQIYDLDLAEITDEDVKLWGAVTLHSACQKEGLRK